MIGTHLFPSSLLTDCYLNHFCQATNNWFMTNHLQYLTIIIQLPISLHLIRTQTRGAHSALCRFIGIMCLTMYLSGAPAVVAAGAVVHDRDDWLVVLATKGGLCFCCFIYSCMNYIGLISILQNGLLLCLPWFLINTFQNWLLLFDMCGVS